MEDSFRKSMAWLHTWAGVVLGSVLFAVFWMGTLSVFDREIDRWMMPATRLAPATAPISLDAVARAVLPEVPAGASQWRVDLPTQRTPVLRFTYKAADEEPAPRQLDPQRLAFLPEQGTLGGSGFFFPFHYGLHLQWMEIGKWIVGVAAMSMLLLLVSGVIIHRKIFVQFFTFRPRKSLQRSSLDLHNLVGVLGLPFHFIITLSGMVIFMMIYFPQAYSGAYGAGKGARAEFFADAYGKYSRPRANAPGALASLDAMAEVARREWDGAQSKSQPYESQPYFVRVWHPGDANSYVELRRSYAREVTMNVDQIFFDAASGEVLHRFQAAPVMSAQRFISGIHFIQFEHWTLRWLYFMAGLAGCVLIATGFLFWLEARRARHTARGLAGVRVVEGLTIGSVTGIVIATLAFLAANRLLPDGQARAALEVWTFYLTWLASFVHAWWRGKAAWSEQAWTVCVLAAGCVLLNAVTTGDHPLRALAQGKWAVAGVDLMLLALAALAAWSARKLAGKPIPAAALRAQA